MPYIITTTVPDRSGALIGPPPHRGEPKRIEIARLAVDTLDEARKAISSSPMGMTYTAMRVYGAQVDTQQRGEKFASQVNSLDESGGTIGPLPDGTVIQVTQEAGR